MDTKLTSSNFVIIVICLILVIVVIYFLRKNYLLKKYPPGTGQKITIHHRVSDKPHWYHPYAYKHYRIIREYNTNTRIENHQKKHDHMVEYEVWT